MRKDHHSSKESDDEKYVLKLSCEVFLPWIFILYL